MAEERSQEVQKYLTLVKLQPDNPENHFHLGLAYEHSGDNLEAVKGYDQAIKLNPRHSLAHLHLGFQFARGGDTDRALTAWMNAFDYDPNLGVKFASDPHTQREYKQKIDASMQTFQKPILINPKNAFAHYQLGTAYKFFNQNELSLQSLKRALDINPRLWEAYHTCGEIYSKLNQNKLAINNFKQAVEANPRYADSHYQLAVVYERENQSSLAIKHIEEASRLDPDKAQYYFAQGRMLMKQTKYKNAMKFIQQGLDLEKQNAEGYLLLAECCKELYRPDLAMVSYERAVEFNPNFAAAIYELGTIALQLGEIPKAISSFERALHLNPDDPYAHYHLAQAYVRQNELENAEKHYTKAAELSPKDAFAAYNLGQVRQQLGMLPEALDALRKAVALQPQDATYHLVLAKCAMAQGENDEAVTHLREAIRFNPNDLETNFLLADVMMTMGKFDEAISMFRKVTEISPESVDAHNRLAEAFYKLEMFDYAFETYQQALRIDSKHVMSLHGMGKLYLKYRNKPSIAVDFFQQGLELDPSHAASLASLGEAYIALNQPERALEFFERKLEENRENPDYLSKYAEALALAGQSGKAVEELKRALQLQPENVGLRSTLARMYLQDKRYADALDQFQRLAQQQPREAEHHFQMGAIFEALGEKEKAGRAYNDALVRKPDHEEAMERLEVIYEGREIPRPQPMAPEPVQTVERPAASAAVSASSSASDLNAPAPAAAEDDDPLGNLEQLLGVGSLDVSEPPPPPPSMEAATPAPEASPSASADSQAPEQSTDDLLTSLLGGGSLDADEAPPPVPGHEESWPDLGAGSSQPEADAEFPPVGVPSEEEPSAIEETVPVDDEAAAETASLPELESEPEIEDAPTESWQSMLDTEEPAAPAAEPDVVEPEVVSFAEPEPEPTFEPTFEPSVEPEATPEPESAAPAPPAVPAAADTGDLSDFLRDLGYTDEPEAPAAAPVAVQAEPSVEDLLGLSTETVEPAAQEPAVLEAAVASEPEPAAEELAEELFGVNFNPSEVDEPATLETKEDTEAPAQQVEPEAADAAWPTVAEPAVDETFGLTSDPAPAAAVDEPSDVVPAAEEILAAEDDPAAEQASAFEEAAAEETAPADPAPALSAESEALSQALGVGEMSAEDLFGIGVSVEAPAAETSAVEAPAVEADELPAEPELQEPVHQEVPAFTATPDELEGADVVASEPQAIPVAEAEVPFQPAPVDGSALLQQAVVAQVQGNLNEAEEKFKLLLAAEPDNFVGLLNYGQFLRSSREDTDTSLPLLQRGRELAQQAGDTTRVKLFDRELSSAGASGESSAPAVQSFADLDEALEMVQDFLDLGKLDRARGRLEKLLDQHPGHPQVLMLLAQLAGQTQNWAEAARYLENAAASQPSDAVYQELLDAYEKAGDEDGRQAARGRWVAFNPALAPAEEETPEDGYLELERAGQWPEALASLATLITAEPERAEALEAERSRLYGLWLSATESAGDVRGALDVVRSQRESQGDSPELQAATNRLYEAWAAGHEGAHEWEAAASVRGDMLALGLLDGDALASVYSRWSDELTAAGDYEAATEVWDKAASVAALEDTARARREALFLEWSQALRASGDYASALSVLEQGGLETPAVRAEAGVLFAAWTRHFQDEGDMEQAIDVLTREKAMLGASPELDERIIQCYRFWHEGLAEDGQTEAAEEVLARLKAEYPHAVPDVDPWAEREAEIDSLQASGDLVGAMAVAEAFRAERPEAEARWQALRTSRLEQLQGEGDWETWRTTLDREHHADLAATGFAQRGQSLVDSGSYEEALGWGDHWREWDAEAGQSYRVSSAQAWVSQLATEDPQGALERARLLDMPELAEQQGRLNESLLQSELAEKNYAAALHRADALPEPSGVRARVWDRWAADLSEEGEHEEALNVLAQWIEADPGNLEPQRRTVATYETWSNELAEADHTAAAVAVLEQLLASDLPLLSGDVELRGRLAERSSALAAPPEPEAPAEAAEPVTEAAEVESVASTATVADGELLETEASAEAPAGTEAPELPMVNAGEMVPQSTETAPAEETTVIEPTVGDDAAERAEAQEVASEPLPGQDSLVETAPSAEESA